MIPRVGQKIGPYEILGRLGTGGMGLVFSAWDGRLHRDVAIKLLKEEFLNSTMRSRFLGEARAASRLNHPNICTIFDIGEEQDCPYMVMELLKGDTLRGRMKQGPIPVETLIQVATQVAEALSVAHEHGIVHRDIKPANVVLVDKPNGAFQTKVLDFGLAKVDMEGMDSHTGLTTTGMTVGTVSYMSPEQARGELLDGRSDLFALGVLMYEMATRKLPFDGATSALVFVQLLNHAPEPLRGLNASVPKALEQVINTCLQKKREDRFQNAQELVLALQRAAQNLETQDKPTSWLFKFAAGLRRESTSQTASEPLQPEDAAQGEAVAPLQMSSDEAFLRPFKPQRKSGSDSQHFEPVNAPYTPSDGYPSQSAGVGQSSALNREDAEGIASTGPVAPSSEERSSVPHVSDAAVAGLEWLDEPGEAPPHDDLPIRNDEPAHSKAWRILIGSLLAAAIVVITIAVALSKRRVAAPQTAQSVSVLTVVNHTGDGVLADVVLGGLRLSLQQSSWLGVRSGGLPADHSLSELPQVGSSEFSALQEQARAEGAAAFALGEVHIEGHTYVLELHVFDTATSALMGVCNSTAGTRERLLGAVDLLAANLRSVLGEPAASINGSATPLNKMATSNMDALAAFAQASSFEAQDRFFQAAAAYERAAALDTDFAQPHVRLANLYYRQHASVSASSEARKAANAANADEETRLLASAEQALYATGDLQNAAALLAQLTAKYQNADTGFSFLATTQRLQGDFTHALASAERAQKLAPRDHLALVERELALLALERGEEVIKAQQQRGVTQRSTSPELLAHFVRGEAVTPAVLDSAASEDLDAQMTGAALLDASGQAEAGLSKWRAIAQQATTSPALASASAYALSQATLNRALQGDCATSTELNRAASTMGGGVETDFALGLSAGLCGNVADTRVRLASLTADYPHSSWVKGFYSSDLNAVLQWKSGALSDAVTTLQSAAQFDQVSWNQYILSQVYLAQNQPQPATVTLQTSLRHAGTLVQRNAPLLPLTYVSLARAFARNGDIANAAKAYQQAAIFLSGAEAGNSLLLEAREGSVQ